MILTKIRKMLPEMPPNFKRIGGYILDHEQSVAFASIYTVSAAIGVSNASLVRFAKSLGLDGYQGLKHEVQEEMRHRLSPYDKIALRELDLLPEEKRLQKLCQNELNILRNTYDNLKLEDLRTMVEGIRRARKIFVCGFGASRHMARTLEYALQSSITKDIACISGSVSDYSPVLKSICDEDLIFIMTFPPYSDEVKHVARVAKDRDASLYLFTDSASCPIYHKADMTLKCDTNSLLLSNSYVGLVSLMNILVHMVFLHSKDASIDSRSQTIVMQESGYASIHAEKGES